MASIRKRKGLWQVQVRRKGSQSVSKSFALKSDAQEWAREIERQIDRAELAPDRRTLDTITLGELVMRYRDEVVPRKKGRDIETIILNAFLREAVCRKPLSRVTTADFASYRDRRLETITAKSLKRQLSPLQNMFEVARDEWAIPIMSNPLDRLKLKIIDTRRERRLRDGEYERLLDAASTRRNRYIRGIIILAVETGMRRGEILALRWQEVDLQRQLLKVLERKNGYSRTIPLTPVAFELLQGSGQSHERVFPVTTNALRLSWQRITRRAGITDLHFHDLRHEAISRFFEMGLTVPEVGSVSGHRTVTMLARYSHGKFSRISAALKENDRPKSSS